MTKFCAAAIAAITVASSSAFTFPVRISSAAVSVGNQRIPSYLRVHVSGSKSSTGIRAHDDASSAVTMMARAGRDEEASSRRDVIAGVGKALAAAVAFTALSFGEPRNVQAFGPVKMPLTEPEYRAVACPPKTQVPGEKAGAGLKPVCVQVTVTANNPSPKDIVDSAVFGFVYDEEGTSVVANNPDGASDAGQFAIIPKVPAGNSRVSFQFVAAIEPTEDFGEKKLKFTSLKAIAYAGGKQYGAITECEMNPLAEECDFD